MQSPAFSVGIYTLGCKVNQYESEAIAEAFIKRGGTVLSPTERCDIYVINTCTVTAESDRKARQIIRRAIRTNPDAYILVIGCFSQVAPDRISAIEGVDFVGGNSEKLAVVEQAMTLLREGKKRTSPLRHCPPPDFHGFEPMQITRFDRTRAYVKIEDGCENKCAYCIIPQARGTVRSKQPNQVLQEVRELTVGGCREIVLTGIETASYGKDLDGYGLADLLAEIDRIPNIGRIRLGSLDPSLMRPEIVERIAGLKSLAPHFHLSMQSASDAVLARMKRKYNRRTAWNGMRHLRSLLPNVQFTTDMIVGFPQETEEDFRHSLEFVKEAEFLMVHVFPYSKRKGTVAAEMHGQIEEAVKHERAARLIEAAAETRSRILDRMIGQTADVLFETDTDTVACGHTAEFIEVACHSDIELHSRILPVRIESHDGTRCFGTLTVNAKKEIPKR